MEDYPNPFNLTKAVDLSDEEINRLWVDIAGRANFASVVKPKSPMPMLMLGGKGSGKTHIMRYFSYPLQKMRTQPNIVQGIAREGYLGVYFRCSGLNAHRFLGKKQPDETWQQVFAYYIELWLAQLMLQVIQDISRNDPSLSFNEVAFSKSVIGLFDKSPSGRAPTTVGGVVEMLTEMRKQIDIIVNNSAWTGKLDGLSITTSPGSLVFGIPKLISQRISRFKKICFQYLIDEFENLDLIHQEYMNTLIREKRSPASIKIGARLYGVRTYRTLSAGEENKEQSEFETIVIDDNFRSIHKGYSDFSRALCAKRLKEGGYVVRESLDSYFEEFDARAFLARYTEKFSQKERPHFVRLRSKLREAACNQIEEIIQLLSIPIDPLVERTNVFLFYRAWSNGSTVKDMVKTAQTIRREAKKHLKQPNELGEHKRILDKFKADILAQLVLDSGEKIQYAGLRSFIDMSEGIPRNLLMIFKHIFRWSLFNGELPFAKDKISLESQTKGVIDSSEWFFEDARLTGKEGKNVRDGVSRLAQFLREIRFSDLPPECSICSFSVNRSELSQSVERIIDLSTQYSYLIRAGERKEKNSKRIDTIYQVNGILAPKWDLPIYKRGEISLTRVEAEAIFLPGNDEIFKKVLKSRLLRYNAPFKKNEKQDVLQLFEE